MRAIIFATLLVIAAARPDEATPTDASDATAQPDERPYGDRSGESDEVQILRDDRVYPTASGEYSLDFETSDGTVISESGDGTGPDGAVETQGSVRFTHPDGESFELTYVANAEGGYQPESSALPVAPEFPHPIPQFVLDQIAFAAEEDARRDAEAGGESEQGDDGGDGASEDEGSDGGDGEASQAGTPAGPSVSYSYE